MIVEIGKENKIVDERGRREREERGRRKRTK